jgi:hypothetical protein
MSAAFGHILIISHFHYTYERTSLEFVPLGEISVADRQRRRKRHVRDNDIEPMVLMQRDKQIIEMVYQCRCLRQDQIHELFFGGAKSASQHRLMLLYHHRFLNRIFLTTRASIQFSKVVYTIDKLGAELLRAEMGYPLEDTQPIPGQTGQQFLAHTLAVNDVRVVVMLACRRAGYDLLTWKSESELKAEYDRVQITSKTGRRMTVSLIPDSYFSIDTPLGKAHFFLELDRGQMGLERFKTKIEAYRSYVQQGGYTKRYGAKTVRVLSVTLSEARLLGLKRATEIVGGKERFWFGVLSDLTPETLFQQPVWNIAGREEKVSLIGKAP